MNNEWTAEIEKLRKENKRLRGIIENVNEYAALELDAAEAMDALSPRWVSEVLNLTNKEAEGPLTIRIKELEELLGRVGVYLDKLGVEYEMSELQDFVVSQVINHDRAAEDQTQAALSGKADNE